MMKQPRQFKAKIAELGEVPLLIGVCGPPGGGKSFSSLRLATGMQRVRPGPIVMIDTESGRSKKYADSFKFEYVEFPPPFVPDDFLTAVHYSLSLNPCAIIIDSLSDEHIGIGGVLDWHDAEVPNMGGNEWAAWAKPKASRRRMMTGFLQVKVPLICTFRANEKTRLEKNARGRDVPVNIGYQPIAPSEIIYALDLLCILPPRAEGVPVWKSDKIGEDFIIKLPKYLANCFKEGKPLDEDTGKRLALWAKGTHAATRGEPAKVNPTVGGVEAPTGGVDNSMVVPPTYAADDLYAQVGAELEAAAKDGMTKLQEIWTAAHPRYQNRFKGELPRLKGIAHAADLRRKDEAAA